MEGRREAGRRGEGRRGEGTGGMGWEFTGASPLSSARPEPSQRPLSPSLREKGREKLGNGEGVSRVALLENPVLNAPLLLRLWG